MLEHGGGGECENSKQIGKVIKDGPWHYPSPRSLSSLTICISWWKWPDCQLSKLLGMKIIVQNRYQQLLHHCSSHMWSHPCKMGRRRQQPPLYWPLHWCAWFMKRRWGRGIIWLLLLPASSQAPDSARSDAECLCSGSEIPRIER